MVVNNSTDPAEMEWGLWVVLLGTVLIIAIAVGLVVGYVDPGGFVVLAGLYRPRLAAVLIFATIATGVIGSAGREHRLRQVGTTVLPLAILTALCLLGQVVAEVGTDGPPRTIATSPDGSLAVRARVVKLVAVGDEVQITIRSNAGIRSRERCVYQESGLDPRDVSARFLDPDRIELAFPGGSTEQVLLDREQVRPHTDIGCS